MSTQLTEADNEFFLGLYRNAVDFYQPRMEKRTGVRLGKISVWAHEQLHRHTMRDLRQRLGFMKSLVFRRRLQRLSEATEKTYRDNAHHCIASYYRDAIYVSFSIDIRSHEHGIALMSVHELSHALWERLEGKRLDEKWSGTPVDRKKYRLLVEGFATYAERIWFLDVYPACVRNVLPYTQYDRASIHFRGLQRIRELVKQSGPQILLEIPKRWRSL